MRLSNGLGTVYKTKEKRRKPWRARVTTGWAFDPVLMKHTQIIKDIGYYATKAEALKALMDFHDHPFDLNMMSVTFADCYEGAKKHFTDGRKNNYYAAYKYLEPIKDMPIRSIKANQMQKCIDACTTTQQQEIKTVCHKVYAYALQNEIVDRDPSRYLHSNSVTNRREREVLTCEQATGLENIGEWWSKITLMLLYSGMRTKELKQLDPENIDTENGTIDIQIAKNKSSIRKIPIHSHVLPLFSDYKAQGGNLYGYTHDGLNKALKSFCGHTAHDCRHTFATRMRECGCDPLVLQLLLGHTPTTITERVYTHLTIAELSEYLEQLNYDT
jgi:integrase